MNESPEHPLDDAPGVEARLVAELQRHPPFSLMEPRQVRAFVRRARPRRFGAGEAVIGPQDGAANRLYFVRRGHVQGERGLSDLANGVFHFETGDLFPVSAVLARRPTTTTYRATVDTELLGIAADDARTLAEHSAIFGDFLSRRILQFLDLSRAALQTAYASRNLTEQSLETPLAQLCRHTPVTCRRHEALAEALSRMHEARVGSVVVVDGDNQPEGILTRYDLLGRVTLARLDLSTPIATVMSAPVHVLDAGQTAQDAALLMAVHGVRHVPITRDGRLLGVVSERDLFALHRLSLRQISSRLRSAADVPSLRLIAAEIAPFARNLLAQGVQARQLTALISHLNDVLTSRLVELLAVEHGIDLQRVCWLALGSEGRAEQTLATDQDNALVLDDSLLTQPGALERHRAFGRAVNEALNACGYPLCKGGIMAGEAACCQGLGNWRQRFAQWIDHGAPEDLLKASIFFDFRPLAGQVTLAQRLRRHVTQLARANPRFLHQLASNALQHAPPLNWLGQLDTTRWQGQATLDLKLQGTTLWVDAARVYALAHGLEDTSTRARLLSMASHAGVPLRECHTWVTAFEFLQQLRLRLQLDGCLDPDNPNRMAPDQLNDIDLRILKEALRAARSLQQRMKLDYER